MVRGLVQEEQVRVSGQGAGERCARELAARERREPAIELFVGKAEAVQGTQCADAPVPAARVLEARLRARVALEQRTIVGSLGHLALEAA